MQELVLTEQQRLTAQRDQEIASQYRALREKNPGAPDRRIVETIAVGRSVQPTSVAGVRLSLIRTGTIVPHSKTEKK